MDPETKRTLITCGTSVLCIIVSNIFIYLSSKTNEKNNKNASIFEQQYSKIFSPIHKILFFSSDTDEIKLSFIEKIISNNYKFVPEQIIEEFKNCKNQKILSDTFNEIIMLCYKMLKSKLGYSNIKLNRNEKKNAKKIISNSNIKIYKRIIISLFICLLLIIILISIFSLIFNQTTFVYNIKQILVFLSTILITILVNVIVNYIVIDK